jgi:shikimate dehydrogenase
MSLNMTGATRLNIIVGDPIQQVKSPGGIYVDEAHHPMGRL